MKYSVPAYTMATAYKETINRDVACRKVREDFPKEDVSILNAMWESIDAYVDLYYEEYRRGYDDALSHCKAAIEKLDEV